MRVVIRSDLGYKIGVGYVTIRVYVGTLVHGPDRGLDAVITPRSSGSGSSREIRSTR